MALKKINYTGSSKVILRLCEMVNQLIDGGGGGSKHTIINSSGTSMTDRDGLQFTGATVTDDSVNNRTVVGIPTKLSDFTNDSGFITNTVSNLTNYYTKAQADTLLADKVDKVAGKQLSTEDFTSTLKTKLDGIASGAEVNVQSDWSQSDNTADDYIKNKPTNVSDFNNDSGFITGVDVEDIGDVNLTNLANGQVLKYNSTSQKWENDNESGGGATYTEGDGIDISAQNVISVDTTFSEASTRANITSGDTFATILGKIKKWFTDLPSMFVSKSGDTMSGNLTVDRQDGTTSTAGSSLLSVGNNIAQGTAKNSRGYVDIYGTSAYFARLRAGALTDNRYIDLPDKNGTIATTSDVDTKVSKSGDTMTGSLNILSNSAEVLLGCKTHTNTASQLSHITIGNNINDGTAGASHGGVILYGKSNRFIVLQATNIASSNKTIELPNKSGTLALTSDIPTNTNQLTNGAGFITSSDSAFSLSSGEIGNTQYASNDSHIMLLCTITLGDYYEYLSLLITSSFWGNQHGSADIINIQASVGSSSSETPFVIRRVNLGGYGGNGADRTFYYGSSGNTVYLYVYVTGGNGYGGWNISCLKQRNCSYVVNGTTNVSPSSITPISLGGRINYAERANSDDEGNRIIISYGASLGYSSGTLFLYNKSGIKISQVTISTSSRKFKRNIEPLSEAEAKKILDIETVTFDYTEEKDNYTSRKGYKNIGCIAEDVNEIIPEVVTEDENGEIFGINYTEMIPYLIKMVQMQQEEINNLKAEISALKK